MLGGAGTGPAPPDRGRYMIRTLAILTLVALAPAAFGQDRLVQPLRAGSDRIPGVSRADKGLAGITHGGGSLRVREQESQTFGNRRRFPTSNNPAPGFGHQIRHANLRRHKDRTPTTHRLDGGDAEVL